MRMHLLWGGPPTQEPLTYLDKRICVGFPLSSISGNLTDTPMRLPHFHPAFASSTPTTPRLQALIRPFHTPVGAANVLVDPRGFRVYLTIFLIKILFYFILFYLNFVI